MVYRRASPAVPTRRPSQLRNAHETLAIWVHEVCIQIKYLLIINHKEVYYKTILWHKFDYLLREKLILQNDKIEVLGYISIENYILIWA